MSRSPRLVYVTTLPVTTNLLLKGQLAAMRRAGFDVHAISSPGPELIEAGRREKVSIHPIPIPREVNPTHDVIALARLVQLFRRIKPDVVNASTPKAGLLGMIAARITRVPVRIYLLRGLRLETTEGRLLKVLSQTERIASRCAHRVGCVSTSLQELYIAGGNAPRSKCFVLGKGSSNGVNVARYERNSANIEAGKRLSEDLGIQPGEPRIGFAGRMVEDKGIVPLLDAFDLVRLEFPRAHLLMVGDSLAGDRVQAVIRRRVEATPNVHVLPRMNGLGPFYATLDVLAFPSYREGFPNVPIEASAAGIPVVGFPSTGVVDAVQDGKTGQIVPRGAGPLATALVRYLNNPKLAAKHGEAGHQWAKNYFSPESIWAGWQEVYIEMLRAKGRPLPSTERSSG